MAGPETNQALIEQLNDAIMAEALKSDYFNDHYKEYFQAYPTDFLVYEYAKDRDDFTKALTKLNEAVEGGNTNKAERMENRINNMRNDVFEYLKGIDNPTNAGYTQLETFKNGKNLLAEYSSFSDLRTSLSTPATSTIEKPKVEEPKVEEPKTEEVKIEEVKIEEVKIEEPEQKVEEVKVEEPKGSIDIMAHIEARTAGGHEFSSSEKMGMAQSVLILLDIADKGENSTFANANVKNDTSNAPGYASGNAQNLLNAYKQEHGLSSNEAAFDHLVNRMATDPEFSNKVVKSALDIGTKHDTFEGPGNPASGYAEIEARAEARATMGTNKSADIMAQQFLLNMFEFTGDYDGKYDGSSAQTRIVDGDFGIETRHRLDQLQKEYDDAQGPQKIEPIANLEPIGLDLPEVTIPTDLVGIEEEPNNTDNTAPPLGLNLLELYDKGMREGVYKATYDSRSGSWKVPNGDTYEGSWVKLNNDQASGELMVAAASHAPLPVDDVYARLPEDVQSKITLEDFQKGINNEFGNPANISIHEAAQVFKEIDVSAASVELVKAAIPGYEILSAADGKQQLSLQEIGAYAQGLYNTNAIEVKNGQVEFDKGDLQKKVVIGHRDVGKYQSQNTDNDSINDSAEAVAYAFQKLKGAEAVTLDDKGNLKVNIGDKQVISAEFNANGSITYAALDQKVEELKINGLKDGQQAQIDANNVYTQTAQGDEKAYNEITRVVPATNGLG